MAIKKRGRPKLTYTKYNIVKERRSFVMRLLRRYSYQWKPINEADKEAKVGTKYRCAKCEKLVPRKERHKDHVAPVINVDGWDSFDGVIERLLCEKHEIQILCAPCHKLKTSQENEVRRILRNMPDEEK